MNVTLIYVVTVVLIGVCVGIYRVLARPKSVRTGLFLGAFIGLALGVGRLGHVHSHADSACRGNGVVCRWLVEGTRRRRDRGSRHCRILKSSRMHGLRREDT